MKKLLIVFLCLLSAAAASAQTGNGKLQGVWKIVEEKTAGPNSTIRTQLQPSLLIVTAKHYSILRVISEQPRPTAPLDMSKATAAELLAVWGPFVANAGTYTVAGDKITEYPIVAKSPALMAKDVKQVVSFKLDGDMLWMTSVSSTVFPVTNPSTFKYARVE